MMTKNDVLLNLQTISVLLFSLTKSLSANDVIETCDDAVVNVFGEGSYLAGPTYINAATGYSVSRSSTLKLNFVFNRTNTKTGLDNLLKRNTIFNSNGSENVLTFAATELPLTAAQQNEYPELLTFPMMALPLVIVFKLPKISSLSLSTQSIVDIYMGKITMWNDSILQKLNPGVLLPNKTILPVARMDAPAGDTYVFTSALSSISREWNTSYGSFAGPQFVDNECCESQKWPPNVISYFGNTASGVTGIVSSIPYTIGYTTVDGANLAQATYASIYNQEGSLTVPSVNSIQAAVQYVVDQIVTAKQFTLFNNFFANVNNVKSKDAYPFATLSYIIVNRTTSPQVTCCAMQELIGFVLYVYNRGSDDLSKHYSVIALPDASETAIINYTIPKITCQGNVMYFQYMTSLIKKDMSDYSTKKALMIICVAFGITTCAVIFGCILYYKRSKHIKDTAWFIHSDNFSQTAEILVVTDFIDDIGRSIHSFPSFQHSLQGIEYQERTSTLTKGIGDKMNAFWKQNGNNVFLTKLANNSDVKWSQMTKLSLVRFIKEFQHDNIAYFYGITEMSNSLFFIQQFFSKGSLHHCLQHSEYDITIEMKCCIAKNVIQGLKYLHKKHLAVGFLNSLSCFVDANWTVKISDWQLYTVFNSLNQSLNDLIESKRTSLDSDSILIELLYLDPEIASYNRNEIYKSDVYSFGNLLMEIFTRNTPHHDQFEKGIMSYQSLFNAKFGQNTDVCCISTFDNDIPKNVQTIISHCLAASSGRPDVNWVETKINHIFSVHSNKGMIDVVMASMEKCIEERTSDLKQMTKRLEGILYEVLPPQIACKLLAGELVLPEYFASCTIFFADIVGFTTISARSTPMGVMAFLNEIWTVFDKVLEQFDVYKVDTIGDAYMVASGVPNRNGMLHCKNIADFALSLSMVTHNFKSQHIPTEELKIRMGVNSGAVTAGIVGSKMPQYCIFGDTVNTSSRMESTSLPGKIQLSSNTKELLSKHFPEYIMEVRGNVHVKGKGDMETFWLIKRNDEHPTLTIHVKECYDG